MTFLFVQKICFEDFYVLVLKNCKSYVAECLLVQLENCWDENCTGGGNFKRLFSKTRIFFRHVCIVSRISVNVNGTESNCSLQSGGVGSAACSVRTEGVGRNEVRTQGEASPSKNKKIVLLA